MSDNCSPENCPVSARVDALEKEFDRYRGNSSGTHREMFERIGALEQTRSAQTEKLDTIEDKLDSLTASVGALAAKPGKRWDSIGDKVLWFVLQAVLIVAAVKIGLM